MHEPRVRIVLVEDAEPDVFLVREALEHCGLMFELQVMEDGEQAVDFIESMEQADTVPRPDLILLDLNLPRKTGVQVLERVRRSPACGEVPVVILTSSDSPKDKAMAAQLRATRYFRKPSRLDEFMRLGPLVQELLGVGNPGQLP